MVFQLALEAAPHPRFSAGPGAAIPWRAVLHRGPSPARSARPETPAHRGACRDLHVYLPEPRHLIGYYGIHFLTPETERTTRYHFTAVRWNVLTDESVNGQTRERISVMRRYAFAEQDGPVIEAQQIAADQAGEGPGPLLLSIDIGMAR
jgi:Vanillate O-demethylase oxygenase C-terminal domain